MDSIAALVEMIGSPILVVVGPTAAKKSKLGLRLAKDLGGEIVSADSMQVYRHFDIGTAKPTPEEIATVPHHIVDILEPNELFSAARFIDLADQAIKEIVSRGNLPVVVGGTCLYIRALLHGLFRAPANSLEIRAAHKEVAARDGVAVLYERLVEVDPIAAERIDRNDFVRISRGLEVHEQTGARISDLQAVHNFLPNRYSAVQIGLNPNKAKLHEAIDRRTDKMMEIGWLDEVRSLLSAGYENTHPMGALGYKQLLTHLRGELDLEESVRQTKRDTRRFARRQRTWFVGESGIHWFEEPDQVETNWVKGLFDRAIDLGQGK
ncbi:MAG: tRNA (adenosine(37)-N6)-dimethylallyltransferase MiaA [Pseudomonadota bacterium]